MLLLLLLLWLLLLLLLWLLLLLLLLFLLRLVIFCCSCCTAICCKCFWCNASLLSRLLLLFLQQQFLGSPAGASVHVSNSRTTSCCWLGVAAAVLVSCTSGGVLCWGFLCWRGGPIICRCILPLLLGYCRFWVLLT
jgi:hypothetical protein